MLYAMKSGSCATKQDAGTTIIGVVLADFVGVGEVRWYNKIRRCLRKRIFY